MYCKYCGNELAEGARFCPNCGRRVIERPKGHLDPESNPFASGVYSNGLLQIQLPNEKKSPGGAAALGFFLGWIFLGPLGYGYLGQWNWFWVTFVIEIFAIPLTLGVAYPLLPIILAIHQYQLAQDINMALDGVYDAGAGEVEKPKTASDG